MKSIGFIGLGIMGRPMARNLASAGFEVLAHSRTRESGDDVVTAGGRWVESVAEAAVADAVVTMLPDSPDVESVLAGPGGVFESAKPGALIIDFSTIRPDVAARLAGEARAAGVRMLDAPVSGGEGGAIDGTLSVMVGGDASDYSDALPVFEAVGSTIALVGPSGAGQTVKAANQLVVAGTIELVSEAIVFLEAHGVDMGPAIEVLSGGLAGNEIWTRKAAQMVARDFAPGFRISLHHKDMGIVTAAARAAGVVIPLGAAVAELVASANAQGDGDLDHSALLRLVERLAGRTEATRC